MTASSAVPFADGVSRRRVDALEPAVIHRSSRDFGWSGLLAEIGSHDGWIVDDLVVDGYYLALNIDPKPLEIESREGGRFVRKLVPPGTLVIHPFGESFSFRVRDGSRWAGVVVDPSLVRREGGGRSIGCAARFGSGDPALIAGVRFAADRLRDGTGGALGASQAAAALAANLAASVHSYPLEKRLGGLSPSQIRKVVDFIDCHLGDRLVLDDLSALAALSVWHFARAFKTATGLSPYQFVITRRLTRARQLLTRTDESIASIAVACGFADQAHLTRCFRSSYGLTPAVYRRRCLG